MEMIGNDCGRIIAIAIHITQKILLHDNENMSLFPGYIRQMMRRKQNSYKNFMASLGHLCFERILIPSLFILNGAIKNSITAWSGYFFPPERREA